MTFFFFLFCGAVSLAWHCHLALVTSSVARVWAVVISWWSYSIKVPPIWLPDSVIGQGHHVYVYHDIPAPCCNQLLIKTKMINTYLNWNLNNHFNWNQITLMCTLFFYTGFMFTEAEMSQLCPNVHFYILNFWYSHCIVQRGISVKWGVKNNKNPSNYVLMQIISPDRMLKLDIFFKIKLKEYIF